jgi:hypothetical protein
MYDPKVGEPFVLYVLLLFMTYIHSCPPPLHTLCLIRTINTSHPLISLIICFLYVYRLYYIIVHELGTVSCARDRVTVAADW